VATITPYSIAVGSEGFITFGLISAAVIGMLLGPLPGSVAVLIGSYVGIAVYPQAGVLGWFTPLATGAGALAAGALRSGKGYVVGMIYPCAILLYAISPIAPLAPWFLWLHLIVLPLALTTLTPGVSGVFKRGFYESTTSSRILFIALAAFLAVMTDNIVGSAIAAHYLPIVGLTIPFVAAIFNGVVLIYPVERIVAAIIVTLVVSALLRALRNTPLIDMFEPWSEDGAH